MARKYIKEETPYISEILHGQSFVYEEWEDALRSQDPDRDLEYVDYKFIQGDENIFNAYNLLHS